MLTSIVVLSFLLVGVLGCDVQQFEGGKYTRCTQLAPNYNLYWKLEPTNNSTTTQQSLQTPQEILFAIDIRNNTNGWFGVGFSEAGGMKGADIIVFQKIGGKYTIEDRFGEIYGTPLVDTHVDVVLLGVKEDPNNEQTIAEFKRDLVTCDGTQDRPLKDEMTWVIYAYGSSSTIRYHGDTRGTTYVNFFRDIPPYEMPSDAQTYTMRTSQVSIPAVESVYMCTTHTLPHDQKYHVIAVEAIVTSPLVHHMIARLCKEPPPTNETDAFDCSTSSYCEGPLWVAWGLGAKTTPITGPFGVPMGGDVGAIYVKLEIHYSNPNLISGELDESGLTVIYTSHLREFDAGTITIGQETKTLLIPPRTKAFHIMNECSEQCTNTFPHTMNVIGFAPHMHLAGSKFIVHHIRGDKELPLLFKTDYYDYKFQHRFPVNTTIEPGDRLIAECVYDTSNRPNYTYGGQAESQEMCWGFIGYYPLIPTSACYNREPSGFNKTYCDHIGGNDVPNVLPRPTFTAYDVPPPQSCPPTPTSDTKPWISEYWPYVLSGGLLVLGVAVLVYIIKQKQKSTKHTVHDALLPKEWKKFQKLETESS